MTILDLFFQIMTILDLFLTGVFDGHGGAKVSKYIKQTLYSNFLQQMPEIKNDWNDSNIYSGLGKAVKKVDFEVSKVKNWNRQGSTLSAIYINKIRTNHRNSNDYNPTNNDDNLDSIGTSEHRNRHNDENTKNETKNEETDEEKNYSILTVNIGDSRIVLARGRKAIDLTSDHKPNMR